MPAQHNHTYTNVDETIRVSANIVLKPGLKLENCVHRLFCLKYFSVFGAETSKFDGRSNRYFGHILVTLFCRDNVGTSI